MFVSSDTDTKTSNHDATEIVGLHDDVLYKGLLNEEQIVNLKI